jgi:hypothetical protein
MMADEIKEFSRDEVFGTIFPGAPSPVTPTQQSAAAFTPAVSSAPVAPVTPPNLAMPSKSRAPVGMPDPTKLVETVSKANKALQEETAPPAPPSAIGGLVDQVISNWKPIAATAAATYAVTKAAPIISRGIGAAYNKATQKSPQQILEQTRIDPIFATEQEMTQAREASQKPGPTLTPLENLQQRATDLRAAVQAGNPAVPPQFGPAGAGANVPPSPPYMPSQTPGMPPTVAEMDAAFKAPAPMPTPGPSSPVTGVVNNAVKDMITEVDAPNMRPTYQRNKENPIGPQAYNWVAGQQGPKAPEVWQNIVGDKNVPYSEFMERYKPVYEGAYGGGYGDPDAFNQPAKNSSYRKPSLIPSQIKGAASPAAMGASAITAVIPALAIAGVEGYKGNKEAVDRELKSAWDSLKSVVTWPYDVTKAAAKGDFGPLKDVLMSVNPATLLLNEANKNDKKAIQKMIQDERQAAQVGAGRGIAPPSAYPR